MFCYVAFIGGVATYIDHTHDRSMHACFSTTVYCHTGCVMAIKNEKKYTGAKDSITELKLLVAGSAGMYVYARKVSHCS